MFLASILVCTLTGPCEFHSLKYPFPTRFECGIAIKDGVDHFTSLPQVQYAEGRCIHWGNLIGERKS